MKKFTKHLLVIVLLAISHMSNAQTPSPALVGYWHNWNIWGAPYIQLDQVDSRYNIVDVSFAEPVYGTDYKMAFTPALVTQATFISQLQTLQVQGRKVIISVGGANAPVHLDNTLERDTFITTMSNIINTYGFDGVDIDLEGSSLSLTGGTIAAPIDAKIINLIYAVKKIMENYQIANNKKLILTAAPETAFVQGGKSAYGGIWGAYLPFLHAMRDSMDILHVQLYNSGSMFGVDNVIYTQGTADFIVAMTEAAIVGFSTSGGNFIGFPANKVAIALPACTSAAGGGYTDTNQVIAAMKYLRGMGPKPGNYTLVNAGGYPNLKGMMTWSVNWDAAPGCNGAYQFANTFSTIFGNTPLAIQLGDINAQITNGKTHIEWSTLTENNTSLFDIQRSKNGLDFYTIGQHASKSINGNSANKIMYHFINEDYNYGTTFYRIQQQSFDGENQYSPVVNTMNETKNNITIFPNPANESVKINFPTEFTQNLEVQLLSMTGKLIRNWHIRTLVNNKALDLELSNISSGIYMIKVAYKNQLVFNNLLYKQ